MQDRVKPRVYNPDQKPLGVFKVLLAFDKAVTREKIEFDNNHDKQINKMRRHA